MLTFDGEHIVTIIRKHWLVYALKVSVLFIGGALPLVLGSMLPIQFRAQIAAIAGAEEILSILFILWVLFLWIGAFILWTNYYLDIWVVTDKRIVDVNQRSLFRRDITSLRLEKIQDVSVDVSGLLATLFSFGKLTIHTAGGDEDIVIRNAANPGSAKERLMSLHTKSLEKPIVARDFV